MRWASESLDAVARIVGGGTPSRDTPEYWGGDIPWLTPTDLPPPGHGITDVTHTSESLTNDGLSNSSARLVPTGTILFSSRATIGKIGIAKVPLATNQGFINFIPSPVWEPRFLAYTLRHHTRSIEGLAGSTTFREVTKSAIKQFRVGVPPLSEQRRIVEILDRADELRRLRAEANTRAERILPALFLKMFGDPATNPMGWVIRPLSALAAIKGGKRLPKGEPYSPVPTPFRYIRGTDIQPNRILDDQLMFLTPEVQKHIARYVVGRGDVVITIAGKIGVCAPVPDHLEGANLTENAARLVPLSPESFDNIFLSAFLNSASSQQAILGQVGQVTIAKLALFRIQPLLIPCPPIHLQRQFSERVVALQGVKETSDTSERRIADLWATLLSRAFCGDLTASWREAHMKELLQEMEQQTRDLAHLRKTTP